MSSSVLVLPSARRSPVGGHAVYWGILAVGGCCSLAQAEETCPDARHLPQLTIDNVTDPAVPVVDTWQVLWHQVPISDAQLAMLSRDDRLIERTRREMLGRGMWVYIGMLVAGAGTAVSSAGWVLFGQNPDNISQAATLAMALGGIAVGGAGVLLVTESIQSPLEPHLAPTPRHRLTREEARQLVSVINRRLYDEICEAARASSEVNRTAPP